MSDYAFGLKTPQDLLEKLQREIARLSEAAKPGSPDHRFQADHAFNCAITAWHMSEWVHAANLVTTEAKAKRFGNYDAELVKACADLAICKDIANGSKHFKLDNPDKSPVASTGGRTIGGGGGMIRSPIRSVISSPIRSPLGGGGPVLFVVDVALKDGTRLTARALFENVLAFWQRFLSEALPRPEPTKPKPAT